MHDPVIDPDFMPFVREELEARFAFFDRRSGDPVARFVESAARYRAYVQNPSGYDKRAARRALQIEKDETFWTAATLMHLYTDANRAGNFAQLLERAIGEDTGIADFGSWGEALCGPLELYLEVGLGSPESYRLWLREHLKERNLVAHVLEAARGRTNLEGRTHLDAMLLAPETGFAAHFEAKVTSDIDTKVSHDLLRNQIARNIDAMLEPPGPRVRPPLSLRNPERSVLLLLTPRMFKEHPHSRLYGWLMNEYRRDPGALARDLAHRDGVSWPDVAARLGWATWEDCREILPGSCAWLELLEAPT